MISVVVPVYNKAPYLHKCIDSILSQSYRELEVLLIDDGSGDDSGRICDGYAAADPRVRVFHRENRGASAARNFGILQAAGEYIGFVDADDWIETDMYEVLLGAMNESAKGNGIKSRESIAPPVVVQLMSRVYDMDGQLVIPPVRDDGETEYKSGDDFFRELILHKGDSSFCTKLFRAEFIKNYRFTEGRSNEDFELLVRMIPDLKAGIPTVGKTGYNILYTRESNSRGTYRQKYYEDMMYNAFTAHRFARDHYPEYLKEAERFCYVQALDFLLHIPVEQMRADNAFYKRIVRFTASKQREIIKNRYLTPRQKFSLELLGSCPKGIRSLHGAWMKIKKGGTGK